MLFVINTMKNEKEGVLGEVMDNREFKFNNTAMFRKDERNLREMEEDMDRRKLEMSNKKIKEKKPAKLKVKSETGPYTPRIFDFTKLGKKARQTNNELIIVPSVVKNREIRTYQILKSNLKLLLGILGKHKRAIAK